MKVFIGLHIVVEGVGKSTKVISHESPGEKHFFIVGDQFLGGFDNRQEEDSGNQAVAGVVDGDGTCVIDEVCVFLGEEEQCCEVEVAELFRTPPNTKIRTYIKDDRGSDVGQFLIRTEGDAIRTRGR